MVDRRSRGEHEDGRNIQKHKKDVFRLAAMLTQANVYQTPQLLENDIRSFCEVVMAELPNADFLKAAGLRGVRSEDLVEQLKKSFEL